MGGPAQTCVILKWPAWTPIRSRNAVWDDEVGEPTPTQKPPRPNAPPAAPQRPRAAAAPRWQRRSIPQLRGYAPWRDDRHRTRARVFMDGGASDDACLRFQQWCGLASASADSGATWPEPCGVDRGKAAALVGTGQRRLHPHRGDLPDYPGQLPGADAGPPARRPAARGGSEPAPSTAWLPL